MKQKSKVAKTKNKQEKFAKKDLVLVAFFLCVFFAVLPLVVFSFFGIKTCNTNVIIQPKNDIKISLDKAGYHTGEKISLGVINSGDKAIYLEPCEQINVFERQVDGEWVLTGGESVDIGKSLSQSDGFEKKSSNTGCQIDVPEFEPGIYRLVVPVFYACSQSNRYACEKSQIFHSKNFQVSSSKEVCDSALIGSCDGKSVSVSGTLQKENDVYYLTGVAGLGARIKLVNLNPVSGLENGEGKTYKIEGIFHKASQSCASSGNCIDDYSAPFLDVQKIESVN